MKTKIFGFEFNDAEWEIELHHDGIVVIRKLFGSFQDIARGKWDGEKLIISKWHKCSSHNITSADLKKVIEFLILSTKE